MQRSLNQVAALSLFLAAAWFAYAPAHANSVSGTASPATSPTAPLLGTSAHPAVVRVLPPELSESEKIAMELGRAESAKQDARMVTYTAVLAFFTVVLALSTIALWWVTRGLRNFAAEQASDLKASVAVARSSADAAQLAAHASVASELPILVVESVTFGPRTARASVRISNHGRTPAIVKADCLVIVMDSALPDAPRYPLHTLDRPDRPTVVEPKIAYKIQRSSHISPEDWKRVLSGDTLLWLFGYVEYVDYLKVKRLDGFCFGFQPRPTVMYPSMPPEDGAWLDAGPSSYTYTKQARDPAVDA